MPGARADGSGPRAGRTLRAEGGGLGCRARAITVPGTPVFTDVPEYGTPPGFTTATSSRACATASSFVEAFHQPPPLTNSKTIP